MSFRYVQKVYTLFDAVSLTVSGGATPSRTSDWVETDDAEDLVLSVGNGASTNLDVEVFTSPDKSLIDNLPYASLNLAANQRKSIAVTPGPLFMQVKITNKDSVNATTVTVKLTKRVKH